MNKTDKPGLTAEPFAFVPCPSCGGEGCHYETESRFSRWHLDPPSDIAIPCDECNGLGLIWGVPDEADLDDLRERCGDFEEIENA